MRDVVCIEFFSTRIGNRILLLNCLLLHPIHFTLMKWLNNCNSIWFELLYWRTKLQCYWVRQTYYYSLQTNWNGCVRIVCVNVSKKEIQQKREKNVAMLLTQVKGWPVKNNVITNRKRNKKRLRRRWRKKTTFFLDAKRRMTENCEIDTDLCLGETI